MTDAFIPLAEALERGTAVVGDRAWPQFKRAIQDGVIRVRCTANGDRVDFRPEWVTCIAEFGEFVWTDSLEGVQVAPAGLMDCDTIRFDYTEVCRRRAVTLAKIGRVTEIGVYADGGLDRLWPAVVAETADKTNVPIRTIETEFREWANSLPEWPKKPEAEAWAKRNSYSTGIVRKLQAAGSPRRQGRPHKRAE